MGGTRPKTLAYDPQFDAASRYSEWTVKLVPLEDLDFEFHRRSREIWLDPDTYAADPEYAMACLVAHLDLDQVDDDEDRFDEEQEDFADMLALIRLDRTGSR